MFHLLPSQVDAMTITDYAVVKQYVDDRLEEHAIM